MNKEERKKKSGLVRLLIFAFIMLILVSMLIALNNVGLLKFDKIKVFNKNASKKMAFILLLVYLIVINSINLLK